MWTISYPLTVLNSLRRPETAVCHHVLHFCIMSCHVSAAVVVEEEMEEIVCEKMTKFVGEPFKIFTIIACDQGCVEWILLKSVTCDNIFFKN